MKQNLFNKLWLRVGMIVAIMTTALAGTAKADDYEVTYNYSALGDMLYGAGDASSYWKVPETSGENAVISIPITYQPTSNITITFEIATFGSGDTPSSSNTTITAVGTESNSNWSGSGVSSYPSSSTYVNGVMTITKPDSPTTLGGLTITMGVNSGVKIFRLKSLTVSYTYGGGGDTPTPSGDEQWVLTSLSDLTASDVFVIVGNNGDYYAMSNDKGTGNPPTAVEVTVAESKITSSVGETIKWNISGNATDGYTFYPNGSTTAWLYCTNSNNGVRVGNNANKTFKIQDDYLFHIGTNRYVGIYSSSDWRCYTSINNNILGQTFTFYKKVTGGVIPPSITASDVNIAYGATNGSIVYTVNNVPSPAGTLTASTESDWLTLGAVGTTVPFTCEANSETTPRTATVTLTYTYGTNETVTANVTITQAAVPVSYSTIPAIFAAAQTAGSTATNVNVTFGNWVVSGVGGSNVFVTDNNGNGFIIYTSNHGFAVNNKLGGTVSETPLKLYNGSAEFTNLTSSTTGLTVTNDGEITVITNKTIAELGGVNTGAVITLSNLTYDGTNLSDGTNTIKPHTTLFNGISLTSGNTYNITGVYQQYGSTKEILPRSADDIEEFVAPQHTVSFSVNGVVTSEDVSEGATITFPATPADIDGKTFVGWTTTEITGTTDTAPAIVTSATMGTADVTYYAVFATSTSGGASNTYALVSNVANLNDGDNIILVSTGSYKASGVTYYFTVANGNVNSSNLMDPVDVTISENKVTSTSVAPITLKAVTGGWKLQMGTQYLNYVATKNEIVLDDEGAVNTISIASDVATIGGITDGTDTRNIYYNPNSGNGRFAYYKSAQKPVSIYKQEGGVTYSGYCTTVAVPTSQTVNVSAAGYATIVAEADLTIPAGVEVFAVTVNGAASSAHLEAITGGIPSGAAVLVKASAGEYVFNSAAEEVDAISSNDLVAATTDVTADGTQYCLAKKNDTVGFYKVQAGIVIPAGKAYLVVSNGVKAFYGFDDDDATGISSVESFTEEGAIYNVAGQRLQKMQKGINIVNGKKILK